MRKQGRQVGKLRVDTPICCDAYAFAMHSKQLSVPGHVIVLCYERHLASPPHLSLSLSLSLSPRPFPFPPPPLSSSHALAGTRAHHQRQGKKERERASSEARVSSCRLLKRLETKVMNPSQKQPPIKNIALRLGVRPRTRLGPQRDE